MNELNELYNQANSINNSANGEIQKLQDIYDAIQRLRQQFMDDSKNEEERLNKLQRIKQALSDNK